MEYSLCSNSTLSIDWVLIMNLTHINTTSFDKKKNMKWTNQRVTCVLGEIYCNIYLFANASMVQNCDLKEKKNEF